MTIVSVKTRMFVKPHTDNFIAPDTCGNLQLEISPPGMTVNTVQMQDLQKPGPAADDHFKLQLDIPVIIPGIEDRWIGLTARLVLAVIIGYWHFGCWGRLSMEKIARVLRCGRWQVSKAIRELVAARYLEVDEDGKCHWYFVPEWVEGLRKIWVNPALVRDDGYSMLVAGCTSYVKFRQGENDSTWPAIQEFADDLGVCYHTAARGVAESATQGLIQKKLCSWRYPTRNEYRLTNLGREKTGVFRPERARPNARALGQSIEAERFLTANGVRRGVSPAGLGLSYDCRREDRVFERLRKFGVHWRVARLMAVQWRSKPESVDQAILNAMVWRDVYLQQMRRLGVESPYFNLAAYVVGTLNTANRECHGVKPSRLVRACRAADQDRARAAAGGRLPSSEFEQRRQQQIRRLRSMPVKPTTPHSTTELAIVAQKHDKAAEAEYLRAVQANARYRSGARRKYANSAWKRGIFLDRSC